MCFCFNDTATTEIYTLSLHDALPIYTLYVGAEGPPDVTLPDLGRELRSSQSIPVTFTFGEAGEVTVDVPVSAEGQNRSEEHTSELQSRQYLVCRLLLEKKKNIQLQ